MGESLKHLIKRKLTIGKIKKHGLKGQKCPACKWRVISSETALTCRHCSGSFKKPQGIKERLESMKRFKEDGEAGA